MRCGGIASHSVMAVPDNLVKNLIIVYVEWSSQFVHLNVFVLFAEWTEASWKSLSGHNLQVTIYVNLKDKPSVV